MLRTRAFWGLQNPERAQIIKADLLSLPNSFQRLSQPQSTIQLYPLQRSTVIQALCLSRCPLRGLFSMDTSRLIASLAGFPPVNAPPERRLGRVKCSSSLRGTPRRGAQEASGSLRAQPPPHPQRWKGTQTGNAACSRQPAESPCEAEAVSL